MTNQYQCALFDFDGTLVDSFEGIGKSVQYAVKQAFDIDVADINTLADFMGPPLLQSLKDHFGFDDEQAAQAYLLYRERYTKKGLYECALYDGVEAGLTALKATGITIGVASSKPVHLIEELLAHFGIDHYFNSVIGIRDGYDHMTKTGSIELALDGTGFRQNTAAVAMVGDRWLDAEGAQNCGVDFICAAYSGYLVPGEFESYPCAHFAKTFLDGISFITGQKLEN